MSPAFRRWATAGLTVVGMAYAGCNRRQTSPTASDDLFASGRKIYLEDCAVCHGPEGEGVAGKYPPLNVAPFVVGPSHRLVALVIDGMSGRQRIKGAEYRGIMPAWRGILSDQQVAAVITYVRHSFGNQSSAVSPSLVRKVSIQFIGRHRFWTPAELTALPPE